MPLRFAKNIENALGWRPDANEEGRIQSLNEMPEFLIEYTKRLPDQLRDAFVGFYISEQDRRFVREFIEDVVKSGEDARLWRRGRILVPEFSPRALMQRTVGEIIAMLSPDDGQPWHRLRPARKLWDAREYVTGAPAVERPELDYHFAPEPHVRDLLLGGVKLDPVEDVHIATRRWVAANIARVAMSREIHDFASPEDLIARCFPDLGAISHDALVAARGLLLEVTKLPKDVENVPGFRGADEWYQDR